MLDALTLEKRGIPAAAIGWEYLVKTVGLAMLKLHGMPDYPVATYPRKELIETVADADELAVMAKTLAPQVEAILVQK